MRSIQVGIFDGVFQRAVFDRSVILFDHINNRQPARSVAGNRESYGVSGAVARKAVAAAAGIATVA